MKNENANRRKAGFAKPQLEVILFDNEDVLTTSGDGKPINYSDDEKWDTPKIVQQ